MPDAKPREVIELLKGILNVTTDVALADRLQIPKGTLAAWKNRDAIPADVMDRFEKEYNIQSIIEDIKRRKIRSDVIRSLSLSRPISMLIYERVVRKISDLGSFKRQLSLTMAMSMIETVLSEEIEALSGEENVKPEQAALEIYNKYATAPDEELLRVFMEALASSNERATKLPVMPDMIRSF